MGSAIPHVSNWVNGSHGAASLQTITVTNPYTHIAIATIDSTSAASVTEIVSKAHAHAASSTGWTHTTPVMRHAVLTRAASLLRSRIPEFVELEVSQTGRPIREMRAQLARVPEWLEYFASVARTHEGRVTPFAGPVTNTLTRSPLGVTLLITPWNHPLLIAMKKLAVALAAGNVVVLKPSEMAPLSVLRLGALFQEAGLPDGALSIVSGYGAETGRALCEAKGWGKIDLTGGIGTYRAVAPVAALNMVPLIAELGGKAAVCIFPSVGVDKAVRATLFASFIASGQTCVTGSRILIHDQIYEEFVCALVARTKALRLGDPMNMRTQVGCVINEGAVSRCKTFVQTAVEQGGSVLCGGSSTDSEGKGWFFEPTLIATRSDSDLACNEVFGPVIAIIRCKDEAAIVAAANSSVFALGTSVWTNDFEQAHRVADEIEAGIVWINGHHLNDPSSPWRGFKESGIGGCENGIEAYESYTKVKSTIINYGQQPTWFDEDVENARYG